jgi:hypothetical protein
MSGTAALIARIARLARFSGFQASSQASVRRPGRYRETGRSPGCPGPPPFGRPHHAVDRQPVHPRHRGDRLFDATPSRTKTGQIRSATRQRMFLHQGAQRGRAAQAAEPLGGVGGDGGAHRGSRGWRPRAKGACGFAPCLPWKEPRLKWCRTGTKPQQQGKTSRGVVPIVFEVIDMRSFSNLWYWIALAVLWSSTSHWVLGVPFDMIQRARRRAGRRRPMSRRWWRSTPAGC